jgi:hypothetical protein
MTNFKKIIPQEGRRMPPNDEIPPFFGSCNLYYDSANDGGETAKQLREALVTTKQIQFLGEDNSCLLLSVPRPLDIGTVVNLWGISRKSRDNKSGKLSFRTVTSEVDFHCPEMRMPDWKARLELDDYNLNPEEIKDFCEEMSGQGIGLSQRALHKALGDEDEEGN